MMGETFCSIFFHIKGEEIAGGTSGMSESTFMLRPNLLESFSNRQQETNGRTNSFDLQSWKG